jgi:hypothetical protein
MAEEVTPQVDSTYYEQGIEILEAELERLNTIATLDDRPRLRIEAALEDLRKKLDASN